MWDNFHTSENFHSQHSYTGLWPPMHIRVAAPLLLVDITWSSAQQFVPPVQISWCVFCFIVFSKVLLTSLGGVVLYDRRHGACPSNDLEEPVIMEGTIPKGVHRGLDGVRGHDVGTLAVLWHVSVVVQVGAGWGAVPLLSLLTASPASGPCTFACKAHKFWQVIWAIVNLNGKMEQVWLCLAAGA